MSYPQPNTIIYLLRGIPLDPGYENTLYFQNATAQYSYFQSNIIPTYGTYTQQTYQRVNKDTLRVQVLADTIYDCNYLMFKNASHSSKWFYAFVTEVNYINENTTELVYSVDVFQTWLFDYTLGDCMVEREHVWDDVLGRYTLPEPVTAGDVLIKEKQSWLYDHIWSFNGKTEKLPEYELIIYYAPSNEGKIVINKTTDFRVNDPQNLITTVLGDDPPAIIRNGVYSGLYGVNAYLDISNNKATSQFVYKILQALASANATITSIQQIPYQVFYKAITQFNTPTAQANNPFPVPAQTWFYNWTLSFSYTNGDEEEIYIPKNKKCFVAPYHYFTVSNNTGVRKNYYIENYNNPTNIFRLKVQEVAFPNCEISVYPYNYNGIENDYENSVTLNEFPEPVWSVDSFERWWNNKGSLQLAGLIGNSVVKGLSNSALLGKAVAPEIGAANSLLSAAESVVSSALTIATASKAQSETGGRHNLYGMVNAQNTLGFTSYEMQPRRDVAEVVDNFFSQFGYNICQLKKPNYMYELEGTHRMRPVWNYIKLLSIVYTDSQMPATAEREIERILRKGITLWMSPETVGRYDLSNNYIST